MSLGMVRKRADDLETVPLVERRRLKRVSVKRELLAIMSSSLLLGRGQEPTPNTPPPPVLARARSAADDTFGCA